LRGGTRLPATYTTKGKEKGGRVIGGATRSGLTERPYIWIKRRYRGLGTCEIGRRSIEDIESAGLILNPVLKS
jgi:hypothetical protein